MNRAKIALTGLTAAVTAGILCVTGLAANAKRMAPDSAASPPEAQTQMPKPWMNAALSAGERAGLLLKSMTQDEKFVLVRGLLAMPGRNRTPPPDAIGSAGYVPGVPRLGIPALQETDASLGIANPDDVRPGDDATALPSGLAMAASFDPQIAYDGGAVVGKEAWSKGFNVVLDGGVNLARDPRCGRNFEYAGEDPLLAGILAGEHIRGIQDQHVVSTVKHYALNDQETGRSYANAIIAEAAMRESDLLAFEIAIERGQPASVMCSYNLINGAYACGNHHLLGEVLKGDWQYPGWVMSDWGAVHSVDDALNGLDQESAAEVDSEQFFDEPLKDAVKSGKVPQSRLDDMVRRILTGMFAAGVFDYPPEKTAIDFDANARVAQRAAEDGIVLLKNENNLLPLLKTAKRIAVIGGYANTGVLSGGGSSQVTPAEPYRFSVAVGGEGEWRDSKMVFHASAPLAAIRRLAPGAEVKFNDGRYPQSAAELAGWADVVVVFALQWQGEGWDVPDISLPSGQDELIAAVAAANPKTVVVLETGNPVSMPWLSNVGAVMAAWYPGARGGEAIAGVLFGKVNPSGRLPVTFPLSIDQYPRAAMPGRDLPSRTKFDVEYPEGADVGYRRFAQLDLKPLFPFGHGLSYTCFEYRNLVIENGEALTVRFDVVNTGKLAGKDAPQVYLTDAGGRRVLRLIGFSKLALAPGKTGHVAVKVDPRLLADYDEAAHGWHVRAGDYRIAVGHSSAERTLEAAVAVADMRLKP
jgi:beta-glucosidase